LDLQQQYKYKSYGSTAKPSPLDNWISNNNTNIRATVPQLNPWNHSSYICIVVGDPIIKRGGFSCRTVALIFVLLLEIQLSRGEGLAVEP
jgi:hypothetical protein